MNVVQARKKGRPRRRSRTVTRDYFPLDGGLNLVDSELTVKPGRARAALNYEMGINGGYESMAGYEEYSGEDVDADYQLIEYLSSDVSGPSFQIGETITGGTSTDTGELLTYTNTLGGNNAQLYSEDLDNSTEWSTFEASVTDGAYTMPGGYRVASLSSIATTVLNLGFAAPFIYSNNTFSHTLGDRYFISFYVRNLSNPYGILRCSFGPTPLSITDSATERFNLNTGNLASGTQHVSDAGMEFLEDGVYRCWMVVDSTLPSGTMRLQFDFAGNDIGQVMYLGGTQVIEGATSYRPGYATVTTTPAPIDCGNLVLYNSSGVFQSGETLTGSASAEVVTSDSTASTNSETDSTLHANYTALAEARGSVSVVTGSGPIRGIWMYKGIVYCLRDNEAGTEGQLYVRGGSGWVLVPMAYRIGFDAGSIELLPGDSIDNGSGATGTVEAVQVTSGAWSTSDAAGWIWITDLVGTWANNDPIEVGATQQATVNGTPDSPTIPVGGKYEWRNYAFPVKNSTADTLKERAYFCGGVGECLVLDDTPEGGADYLLFSIDDSMPASIHPTHLGIHNEYLWLGFDTGSIQNSAVSNPLSFSPVFGAAEINVGEKVIGFQEEIGESLVIFGENRVRILAGKSRATFTLGDFNINTGAKEWSIQRLAMGMFLDDRGFATLRSTDRYGDYLDNTISQDIQPLIDQLLRNNTVKCSQLYRSRNIYRCFFDDGTIISIGMRTRRIAGIMQCRYNVVPNVCCSAEDENGVERLFFGADNGRVYQQEEATSFDGEPIVAHIRPAFHHSGSPGVVKKYRQAELDAVTPNAFTITADFRYDDGRAEQAMSSPIEIVNAEQGGYWDEFTWDDFTWDEGLVRTGAIKLEGEGTNISPALRHSSDSEKRHTLRGMSIMWSPRRIDRRTIHG